MQYTGRALVGPARMRMRVRVVRRRRDHERRDEPLLTRRRPPRVRHARRFGHAPARVLVRVVLTLAPRRLMLLRARARARARRGRWLVPVVPVPHVMVMRRRRRDWRGRGRRWCRVRELALGRRRWWRRLRAPLRVDELEVRFCVRLPKRAQLGVRERARAAASARVRHERCGAHELTQRRRGRRVERWGRKPADCVASAEGRGQEGGRRVLGTGRCIARCSRSNLRRLREMSAIMSVWSWSRWNCARTAVSGACRQEHVCGYLPGRPDGSFLGVSSLGNILDLQCTLPRGELDALVAPGLELLL
jgi:hypothetical protein